MQDEYNTYGRLRTGLQTLNREQVVLDSQADWESPAEQDNVTIADGSVLLHLLDASVIDNFESSTPGRTIDVQSETQLTSQADWQGRPVLESKSNGDWLMLYRDATSHSSDDGVWHIRFSEDEGGTWTADDTHPDGSSVSGFPYDGGENAPSDAIVFTAPNGDLIAHFAIRNNSNNTRHGTRQLRSTDGGKTWTDEGQISFDGAADDECIGGQDYFVHPESGDIYVSIFVDPGADFSTPWKSGIAKSTDNGSTWTYIADITSTSEGTDEVGIEYLGGEDIIAVLRDDSQNDTYQSFSSDLGESWSTLEDLSHHYKGVGQRPRLYQDGALTGAADYTDGPLWMVARDRYGSIMDTEDVIIQWSDDDGQSWSDPFVFASGIDDAAYSDLIYRSNNGGYYLATYQGTPSSADVYEYTFEKGAGGVGVYGSGEGLADYYRGNLDVFERRQSGAAENDYTLASNESQEITGIYSLPGDGLGRYPEDGDTIRFLIRDAHDEGEEGPGHPALLTNVTEKDGGFEGYWFSVTNNVPLVDIRRYENGSYTQLNSTDYNVTPNKWYWGEVTLPTTSDDTITFELYGVDLSTLTRGSLLTEVTANDSTYVGQRGIGFMRGSKSGVGEMFDWVGVVE